MWSSRHVVWRESLALEGDLARRHGCVAARALSEYSYLARYTLVGDRGTYARIFSYATPPRCRKVAN
eukprot:3297919-Pleurochrysis_carterae.AAC.1